MPPTNTSERFQYRRTNDGLFMCPHCDYTKKNQSSVNMHINAKHSGPLKHKCEHCNYEAATQQMLKHHLTAKHPTEVSNAESAKAFSCPCEDCKYECRTKAQLRSHYLLKHMSEWVQKFERKAAREDMACECANCGPNLAFKSRPAFLYHLPNCIPAEILANEEVEKGLGI
jgi:hypothetical protein